MHSFKPCASMQFLEAVYLSGGLADTINSYIYIAFVACRMDLFYVPSQSVRSLAGAEFIVSVVRINLQRERR